MRKYFSFIPAALLCAAFFLCSCSSRAYTLRTYHYMDVLDTVSTVQLYLTPEQDKEDYESWIHERLLSYHRLFDAYNSYEGLNNVCTINENAGVAPVAVEEDLFELIKFSVDNMDETGGNTNIAFGSVTQIWKDFMSAVQIEEARAAQMSGEGEAVSYVPTTPFPSEEELTEAARHTDISSLILDEEARTVYLADPDMRLDVGAVAKGYIAEKLADDLAQAGIESACISLGGNVKILGKRLADDGRDYYTSAIQNPQYDPDSEDPAAQNSYLDNMIVRLNDQETMVTSGNYERFVDIGGIRYSHLIDPVTLQPAQQMSSVTILAQDSGLADYLSTALFMVDVETGKEILSHYEGAEACWVTSDYQVYMSSGFADHLVQ